MLNELCQLADALEKARITAPEKFPKLKSLPNVTKKSPCYRIWIGEKCGVISIDTIPQETASKLYKWEPNNGDSFPGLNFRSQYRITDPEKKKQINKWREGKDPVNIVQLKKWCDEAEYLFDEDFVSKLYRCLNSVPMKLLDFFHKQQIGMDSALGILANRMTSAKDFHVTFRDFLWSSLVASESVKTVLDFLVQDGDEKKAVSDDRKNISVFFDITDFHNYEYPVASIQSMELLNRILLATKTSTVTDNDSGLFDAFGDILVENDSKEVMPPVKVAYMKTPVILRAMAKDTPCQKRYGRIASASYPAGQKIRKRASSALAWLSNRAFEDITWGKTDSSELIFSYPEELRPLPPALLSLFGTKKEGLGVESRFINAAEGAISSLRELRSDLRGYMLQVFTLKKMDEARTKIVFHHNYTAQRLVDAVQDWRYGCDNIPEILFKVWGEDKKPMLINPIVPFPLQVPSCMNRVWKMDGKFVKTLKGDDKPLIPSSKGIELLLEEHSERFVPYLLATLNKNTKGLLLFLGNKRLQIDDKNREIVFSVSDKKKYEHHKLLIPSILGLLLHKLGIRKESYMSNAPFLVGRMLKLADELHALYCEIVRENKLPPQLVGNALVVTALESPEQALAQLDRRLAPYLGWAKQYRTKDKDKSRLAGYFLKQFEEAATQMKELSLSQRQTDADRAQQFLGYLSENPKKTENQAMTVKTDTSSIKGA
jgi:hypothetical protein